MLTSVMGFVAVMLAATFGITSISNTYHQVDLAIQEQNRSTLSTSVHKQTCLPQEIAQGERVRGLIVDVPRLSAKSERIDFDGTGYQVTYEVASAPDLVADFYLKELPQRRCLRSVNDVDGLVFQVDGSSMAIKIASTQHSVKEDVARVTYQVGYLKSAVLGESTGLLLAQAEGDSSSTPPGSQYIPSQSPHDGATYAQPTDSNSGSSTGAYPSPTGIESGMFVPFQPTPIQPHLMNDGGQQAYPNPQYPGRTLSYSNQPDPSQQQNRARMFSGQAVEGDRMNAQYGQGQFNPGDNTEEQERQKGERQLADMKRHMGPFVSQIQGIKKRIGPMQKKLLACGADLPEELKNALSSIDGLIENVKAAQDSDEAMAAMEALQDAAEVFRDLGPQMGELMGFCQKMKQAESQVNRMVKDVARLESRAQARKVDSAILGELKSIVNDMKNSVSNAKALAKTSVDEADEMIEGVFEQTDNYREAQATVNMALDLPKGLKEADATVRTITSKMKSLERKKDPVVDELKPLIEELKSQIAEIRVMAKGTIVPEELGEALQGIFEIREQIFDLLQEHGVESNFMPKVQTDKGFQFDFHDSFLPKESL